MEEQGRGEWGTGAGQLGETVGKEGGFQGLLLPLHSQLLWCFVFLAAEGFLEERYLPRKKLPSVRPSAAGVEPNGSALWLPLAFWLPVTLADVLRPLDRVQQAVGVVGFLVNASLALFPLGPCCCAV